MDHHQLALQGCGRGESRTQGCGGELTSESWSLKKEFSGIAFMLCASLRSTGQRIRGWAGSSPRTQCPGRSNAFALNLPRARARCAPCARRRPCGARARVAAMTAAKATPPRARGTARACRASPARAEQRPPREQEVQQLLGKTILVPPEPSVRHHHTRSSHNCTHPAPPTPPRSWRS